MVDKTPEMMFVLFHHDWVISEAVIRKYVIEKSELKLINFFDSPTSSEV